MSSPPIIPLNQMGPQTAPSDVSNEITANNVVSAAPASEPVAGQPMASDETAQGFRPGNRPIQVVAAHPRASIFHSILNTLGGGDKIQYNVDPQTGTMSATRVPQTTGSLAKAVVAGALTGMLAGAGERGPGSVGRSFQAGGGAVESRRQMQDAQQKQQAEKDYENQQQAKVRAAQIMHLNMDTLHTAFNLSQAQDKELADHVAQFKDQVDNIPKEAIVDSNIPSDQVMKKGYQAHGMSAIPDGYVPVYDKDGKQVKDENGIPKSQLTYTIYNPASTGDLNKLVNVKDAAEAGIKPFDKVTNFPEGASITHLAAQQINNEIADRKYILNEANRVAGESKAPQMTMADLKAAIDKDKTLPDALHKYKLTAGSSTEPDGRIDALRQKDPQAAGKVMALFGDEKLEAFKEAREARIKGLGKPEMKLDQAIAIRAKAQAGQKVDPNELSLANSVYTQNITLAGAKAGATEQSKQDVATATEKEQEKFLNTPVDWTMDDAVKVKQMDQFEAERYLKSKGWTLPQNFTELYGIGTGDLDPKRDPQKGYRGTDVVTAQNAAAFIRKAINPNFSDTDFLNRKQMEQEYASKKVNTAGGTIYAAGVAARHLQSLEKAAEALSNGNIQAFNAVANELQVQTGQPAPVVFSAIANKVNSEVEKVVSGGAPLEAQLKEMGKTTPTKSSLPQIRGITKGYLNLMAGRLSELDAPYVQQTGKHITINDEAKEIYKSHGEGLNADWMLAKSSGHLPAEHVVNPQTKPFAPPAGAPAATGQPDGAKLKDAKGNVVAVSKGGQWQQPQ